MEPNEQRIVLFAINQDNDGRMCIQNEFQPNSGHGSILIDEWLEIFGEQLFRLRGTNMQQAVFWHGRLCEVLHEKVQNDFIVIRMLFTEHYTEVSFERLEKKESMSLYAPWYRETVIFPSVF